MNGIYPTVDEQMSIAERKGEATFAATHGSAARVICNWCKDKNLARKQRVTDDGKWVVWVHSYTDDEGKEHLWPCDGAEIKPQND